MFHIHQLKSSKVSYDEAGNTVRGTALIKLESLVAGTCLNIKINFLRRIK